MRAAGGSETPRATGAAARLLAALLATAVLPSGVASASAACRGRCQAPIRTLAYAITECRSDAHGLVARQALKIRRGEREPVTVFEVAATEPVPDPLELCRRFGESRFGTGSVVAGAVQRLAVSPDASGVVFEVTGQHAIVPLTALPPEQEGIFYVRSDGRGLRRLGPPSREAAFRFVLNQFAPGGFSAFVFPAFDFSPAGRRVAFTDLGPGPSGEDAVQIVTLDIATGSRTQLTQLPRRSVPDPTLPDTGFPKFVDDDTVAFDTFTDPDGSNPEGDLVTFTVKTDGSGLKRVPIPRATAGSQIVPSFQVTGIGNLLRLTVPGTPVRTYPEFPTLPITEMFVRQGVNLLQLTNFRRVDTGGAFVGRNRGRVFFEASADPLGRNPGEYCQLFSIDTLGAHVRQLTHFGGREPSQSGCLLEPPPGCSLGAAFQDPVTRAIVIESTCDPLGTNPNGGQIFAMRTDGSGLRQLTAVRGFVVEPSGAVVVELPGPWAYSSQ